MADEKQEAAAEDSSGGGPTLMDALGRMIVAHQELLNCSMVMFRLLQEAGLDERKLPPSVVAALGRIRRSSDSPPVFGGGSKGET